MLIQSLRICSFLRQLDGAEELETAPILPKAPQKLPSPDSIFLVSRPLGVLPIDSRRFFLE
jgi:hypothetical protein